MKFNDIKDSMSLNFHCVMCLCVTVSASARACVRRCVCWASSLHDITAFKGCLGIGLNHKYS
jgi:hypothetical protein